MLVKLSQVDPRRSLADPPDSTLVGRLGGAATEEVHDMGDVGIDHHERAAVDLREPRGQSRVERGRR
jgi:hypothetical protein